MQKNYDYILKFVLVGSSSVGKSSILRRFADDQFQESYISTIGIDFRFKLPFHYEGLSIQMIIISNYKYGIQQDKKDFEEQLNLITKEQVLLLQLMISLIQKPFKILPLSGSNKQNSIPHRIAFSALQINVTKEKKLLSLKIISNLWNRTILNIIRQVRNKGSTLHKVFQKSPRRLLRNKQKQISLIPLILQCLKAIKGRTIKNAAIDEIDAKMVKSDFILQLVLVRIFYMNKSRMQLNRFDDYG